MLYHRVLNESVCVSKETKGFELDFDAELPVKERVGKQRTDYIVTVKKFLDSGKDHAQIKIPKDESTKLSGLRIGLKITIERMSVNDKVKPAILEGKLYLYSRDYAKDKGWKWETKRTKKLGKKTVISVE